MNLLKTLLGGVMAGSGLGGMSGSVLAKSLMGGLPLDDAIPGRKKRKGAAGALLNDSGNQNQ
jgi:hypothetical protein